MYLILVRTRGDTAGIGFHQNGRDRVDSSPRNRKSSTCVISTWSDRDRRAHWSPRGAMRSARSSSWFDQGFIVIFTDRTASGGLSSRSWSDGHDEAWSSSLRGAPGASDFHLTGDDREAWSRDRDHAFLTWSPSDGLEGSWKNSTIAMRSNRNRTAIELRSCSFSVESSDRSFPLHQTAIDGASTSRSIADRGAIVAPIEAESRPIHGQFGSHDIFNWNRFHDPSNQLPRPRQLPTILGQNPL